MSSFERDRRVEQVLRSLQHDRSGLALHVHDALYAQQVRASQLSERLQRSVQTFPGKWLVEPQTEGTNRGIVSAALTPNAFCDPGWQRNLSRRLSYL